VPDADVPFARGWGMSVEIEDLHRVVEAAARHGRRVVLGGHSLGGSITTAYATWDFNGKAGATDLAGLVYIDGGSNPQPVTADRANMSLQALRSGSPWLTFGGIPAPYTGLFNATGSTGVKIAPHALSLGYSWPALPANLKPPVRPTNEAQYGYALDVKSSPPGLRAAQAHLGQLAANGDPRGWDGTGALTPIRRFAMMFSGFGLNNVDGTEWYFPQRLTDDTRAVGNGLANPAQRILNVHATMGRRLPRSLRIYAFGAALGGPGVLQAATALARQSGIPMRNLTLIDRHRVYAHNDPAGAFPNNVFFKHLMPFLKSVARGASKRR
jgi:pimeloyl-ACP methyl ester carboxylesterase